MKTTLKIFISYKSNTCDANKIRKCEEPWRFFMSLQSFVLSEKARGKGSTLETQGRRHQKSKIRVSVAPRKGLMSSKNRSSQKYKMQLVSLHDRLARSLQATVTNIWMYKFPLSAEGLSRNLIIYWWKQKWYQQCIQHNTHAEMFTKNLINNLLLQLCQSCWHIPQRIKPIRMHVFESVMVGSQQHTLQIFSLWSHFLFIPQQPLMYLCQWVPDWTIAPSCWKVSWTLDWWISIQPWLTLSWQDMTFRSRTRITALKNS